MIERELKGAQRLPGPVGKRPAVEATDYVRQKPARSFKMTLHADLHRALFPQPRRIHNRAPDVRKRRAGLPYRLNVVAARSVTSLTVNPLWQLPCKHRLRSCVLMAGRNRWIGVVAE